jgi:hypothetical protein
MKIKHDVLNLCHVGGTFDTSFCQVNGWHWLDIHAIKILSFLLKIGNFINIIINLHSKLNFNFHLGLRPSQPCSKTKIKF